MLGLLIELEYAGSTIQRLYYSMALLILQP